VKPLTLTHLLSCFFLIASLCGCALTGEKSYEARLVPVSQSEALSMINSYRAQYGLKPLRYDPQLLPVAQDMALYVARRGSIKTLSHSISGLSRRMSKHNVPHRGAAENLGAGYRSLSAAMTGWKQSAGHNANLKHKQMTHIAIARAKSDAKRWQDYWVLIFSLKE
jgi:uncharacterized protein YkwD